MLYPVPTVYGQLFTDLNLVAAATTAAGREVVARPTVWIRVPELAIRTVARLPIPTMLDVRRGLLLRRGCRRTGYDPGGLGDNSESGRLRWEVPPANIEWQHFRTSPKQW